MKQISVQIEELSIKKNRGQNYKYECWVYAIIFKKIEFNLKN